MHGRTEAEDTLWLKEDEIQKRTKGRREQDVVFKVGLYKSTDCRRKRSFKRNDCEQKKM